MGRREEVDAEGHQLKTAVTNTRARSSQSGIRVTSVTSPGTGFAPPIAGVSQSER
jgi:hypothetical protein